jgi:hypothetical protein
MITSSSKASLKRYHKPSDVPEQYATHRLSISVKYINNNNNKATILFESNLSFLKVTYN